MADILNLQAMNESPRGQKSHLGPSLGSMWHGHLAPCSTKDFCLFSPPLFMESVLKRAA